MYLLLFIAVQLLNKIYENGVSSSMSNTNTIMRRSSIQSIKTFSYKYIAYCVLAFLEWNRNYTEVKVYFPAYKIKHMRDEHSQTSLEYQILWGDQNMKYFHGKVSLHDVNFRNMLYIYTETRWGKCGWIFKLFFIRKYI